MKRCSWSRKAQESSSESGQVGDGLPSFTDPTELAEEITQFLGIGTPRLGILLERLRRAVEIAGPRQISQVLAVEGHFTESQARAIVRALRGLTGNNGSDSEGKGAAR